MPISEIRHFPPKILDNYLIIIYKSRHSLRIFSNHPKRYLSPKILQCDYLGWINHFRCIFHFT